MEPLEGEILRSLSVEEAFKHVRWLADEVPHRLAGTPQEKRAAAYVAEVLQGYGIEAQIQEFDALVSFPLDAELRVLAPEQRVIRCRPHAQIASTLPEGIEGELVYVGAGSEEDFGAHEVRGRIAMTEYSYAPPLDEQMRLADEHGARALIVMCWGLPEHNVLSYGTTKPLWGNPTPETMDQLPHIPSLRITRQAGEYLKELCQRGEVRVWLRAEASREWAKVTQPVGSLPGRVDSEKYLLLAGHLDAWAAGVTCNATGVAMLMELARVFARLPLRRGLKVAFWTAHETGGMEGSTWYIDNHWSELNHHCVGHINIDTPGPTGGTRFVPRATLEATAFFNRTIQEILGEEVPVENCGRLSRTGDQSFFGIGISSFTGRMALPRQVIEEWHWAGLGWWYHSEVDTIDKADPTNFGRTMRVMATLAYRMADSPLLPFEFMSVAQEFSRRLKELEGEAQGRLPLAPAMERAEAFQAQAQALHSAIERLRAKLGELDQGRAEAACGAANRSLMRLSRILNPLLYTVSGKYAQDTYGLSALTTSIPAMREMRELGALDPDEGYYKALCTKLVRERNKVVDALEKATEEAQMALRGIEEGLTR